MSTYHPPAARLVAFAFVIAGLSSTGSAQWAAPYLGSDHYHHHRPRHYVPSPSPGTWSDLENAPSILLFFGAANPLLLTDGSVIVQDVFSGGWARLSPDENGSYINGSWFGSGLSAGSLPGDYGPYVHSSAVLADGRVLIEGGELNYQDDELLIIGKEVNLGAILDPVTGQWTPVTPPAGWSTIGDGPSTVLPDGTYMQGNCCTNQEALFDAKTLTWTSIGSGKFGTNQNEGWTLLPDGNVLTVDTYVSDYNPNGMNSEGFIPRTGHWQSAGSTTVQLWDSQAACGDKDPSFQIGPGILRPDGTVFYAGADTCPGTPGKTAIYDTRTRKWSAGPTFPGDLDVAGGPAAVEPNGKVLLMASPGLNDGPAQFFELDGTTLNPVPPSADAPESTSSQAMMLVLPTGQILLTDGTEDVEIYTPAPGYKHDWAPHIRWIDTAMSGGAFELNSGQTYQIFGRRFNGLTQGAFYGSQQAATNYPIVRITNNATGHVFYCRTHDHSSMAVASEAEVFTFFDVPSGIETGAGKLEVVANGIPSEAKDVTVF